MASDPQEPVAQNQIIEHDWRIKALEKSSEVFVDQLRAIEERNASRMDALSIKLDAAMTHMRNHACPTPGACTALMRDMTTVTSDIERLEAVVTKFESDKEKLSERYDRERREIVDKLNQINTQIEVGKSSLRVTIFWVGIMASAIGGVASIALPSLMAILRAQ